VVDGSLVGKASSPESQYERVDDDRHEQEQEASCDDGKTGAQDATHADSRRTMVHSVDCLSCSHSVLAMARGPAETRRRQLSVTRLDSFVQSTSAAAPVASAIATAAGVWAQRTPRARFRSPRA